MLRQTLCLGDNKREMDDEDCHEQQHMTNGDRLPQTNGVCRKYICPEMCFYCFDVLIAHLNHTSSPKAPHFPNDEFPLFVTWKTGRDRKLRGCMGTFTARKLHRGLAEYALTSSIRDSRFQPVSLDEVSKLECGVSLLINFEKAKDYNDWEVAMEFITPSDKVTRLINAIATTKSEIGVHGIQIEFVDGGRVKSATYLPEVSPDQGWTKVETIDSLLHKGGYRAKVTEEYRKTIRLTRYQTEKCVVSYEDYSRQRRRHRPY